MYAIRSYYGTDFFKWAKSKDYTPVLVWVQTDQRTAMSRSLKTYDITKEMYEQLVKQFEPPQANESAVVVSGKHTYATQAKTVLV